MRGKAEQGVAGYSPQVASPQNADVGAMKMKLWLTLMALALGAGCVSHLPAPINTSSLSPGYDLAFWLVRTNDFVITQFGGAPEISRELTDIIVQKATKDLSPVSVTIYLGNGVAVSNSFWLQEMAEARGVTNISVRLDQTQPPRPGSNNEKLQQEGPGYPPQGVGSPAP